MAAPLALLCGLCWASPSYCADFLSGASRAICRGDSGAPSTPAAGYAYGPRAQMSVGLDAALLRLGPRSAGTRIGFAALTELVGLKRRGPFEVESLRGELELGAAFAYSNPVLHPGRTWELGFGVGRAFAHLLDGYSLQDEYRSDDVPFAAGGYYLAADAALRAPLAEAWTFTGRLGLRAYTNFWPDVAGQTEASDAVASHLQEGGKWQTSFELGVRFAYTSSLQPLARIYADVIEPHDDSGKTLWLSRLLLGVALPGAYFEALPFLYSEAGHGSGLAVNRSQLRLGAGVRLYAR